MATVLFLQRDSYEIFGIMYLSSCIVRVGHNTDVLIEAEEKGNFYRKIAEIKPDIVAFSVMTGLHGWVIKTANEIKKRFSSHIIAGGPHCTFFPEFIGESSVDAICRGEGEETIVRYLEVYSNKGAFHKIPGWWIKNGGDILKNDIYSLNSNLDSIPHPDRTIYKKRYRLPNSRTCCSMLVTRGCPYNCSFCYNQFLKNMYAGKGAYVRRHSVGRVLEEIKCARRQYNNDLRWISFIDDLFVADRQWLEEFLKRYVIEVGLPFGCGLRADIVDEKMIKMLKNSGCRAVAFGVESGNVELRNGVLNKRISNEDIINVGILLQKYKIRFSTFNMFNIPGETLEHAEETRKLNLKIRDGNYPWSGLLQPYRGTSIFCCAGTLGLVPRDGIGADLFHIASIRQKDTEKLENYNAYFYWMIRIPLLRPILIWLVNHPVKLFSKMSLILVSFHRSVSLMYPFEGVASIFTTINAGLKRIKAYV